MYVRHQESSSKGFLLVLILVFGAVFLLMISSFIGFVITQSQVVMQRYALDRAGEVAEAGLNYYKWFLAHYPNDVTNGTGLPGPYVHTYYDPELGPIGEFSIAVSSTTYCGDVSSIEVESTGMMYDTPGISRTVRARYARPTVAEYAYIINSNVWAGTSLSIIGPYHSNLGIRMDATNQSVVTSGVATWLCTSTFGCTPDASRGGVFTTTSSSNPLLFNFPSAPINFTDLTVDLANMETRAQTSGGIHLPASTNHGYHIVFNSNGTVTVRRVTDTYSYLTYSVERGDFTERNIIRSSVLHGTYTLNSACPLIFVRDKLWIEGTLNQKVTVAAAGTDIFGEPASIILQGNITYVDPEDDGLLAVAQQDVLFGINVPDNMVVNGIFVAQNGRFGRNLYTSTRLPDPSGPLNFKPNYQRNSITMNGTIVSNGRVGTQWVNSSGVFNSGFRNRTNTYDRNLVEDPPPLVPNTSDVYEFVDWREEDG